MVDLRRLGSPERPTFGLDTFGDLEKDPEDPAGGPVHHAGALGLDGAAHRGLAHAAEDIVQEVLVDAEVALEVGIFDGVAVQLQPARATYNLECLHAVGVLHQHLQ